MGYIVKLSDLPSKLDSLDLVLDKIVEGDCLDLMRRMPDGCVELVLTSPPYPGAKMWKEESEKLEKLNLVALESAAGILKDSAVLAWQVADVPQGDHGVMQTTTTTTIKAVTDLGLKWRTHIIWDKGITNPLPAPCFMRRPAVVHLTHEHILVFHKGGWKPREKHWRKGLRGDWRLRSVWTIGPESAKRIGHIAPFPLKLAWRCVDLFSIENEVVFDPFLGSGTTAVAAKKLGRHFIGCEISPDYCKIAERRLLELDAQPGLFGKGMASTPYQSSESRPGRACGPDSGDCGPSGGREPAAQVHLFRNPK